MLQSIPIFTNANATPSKVTQSCVDQYLDSILLQTIYTSAHQESLASMGLPAPQVSNLLLALLFVKMLPSNIRHCTALVAKGTFQGVSKNQNKGKLKGLLWFGREIHSQEWCPEDGQI